MATLTALTRAPAATLAECELTYLDRAPIDLALARSQHRHYVEALRALGCTVRELPADDDLADSVFVEDTAVVVDELAVVTRPGAASRRGETASIAAVLAAYRPLREILEPGTLDGGDVCEAGNHFLIGISARTNAEGAAQLARWLAGGGCTCDCIDIRSTPGILHLKSGLSYIGDNRMVVIDSLADHPALARYESVRVEPGEEYAANCIRVNDRLLLPGGYPRLSARLAALGYTVVELEMSEFRKMDGGLSCLSLRF